MYRRAVKLRQERFARQTAVSGQVKSPPATQSGFEPIDDADLCAALDAEERRLQCTTPATQSGFRSIDDADLCAALDAEELALQPASPPITYRQFAPSKHSTPTPISPRLPPQPEEAPVSRVRQKMREVRAESARLRVARETVDRIQARIALLRGEAQNMTQDACMTVDADATAQDEEEDADVVLFEDEVEGSGVDIIGPSQ
jgi:hypothetical protein